MRTDLESYLLAMPYIKIHETYIHVYYLSLLKRVVACRWAPRRNDIIMFPTLACAALTATAWR